MMTLVAQLRPTPSLAMSPAIPSRSNDPLPRWAHTRALIRSDMDRALEMVGNPQSRVQRIFWYLQPTALSLVLYRIYHHLYRHGWRSLALLLYTMNVYLTRIEIPPRTVIGEACLLGHFPVVLNGRIGKRFTFFGDGGTGGGLGSDDIGGGPGLPVIGDDVVMAVRALVLGPVHIGDGARLGPSCTVMRDVPAGAVVVGPPSRVSGGEAPAVAKATNEGPTE